MRIICFAIFFLLNNVDASPEVSLDLRAYVDPEVNIERIDDSGDLDIFSRAERRYRITSNVEKDVKVTFQSQNGWKLRHENDDKAFISYEGIFRGTNREEVIGEKNNVVSLAQSDFLDQEYEFCMMFKAIGSMKNFAAGRYFDRVTISVSAKY